MFLGGGDVGNGINKSYLNLSSIGGLILVSCALLGNLNGIRIFVSSSIDGGGGKAHILQLNIAMIITSRFIYVILISTSKLNRWVGNVTDTNSSLLRSKVQVQRPACFTSAKQRVKEIQKALVMTLTA